VDVDADADLNVDVNVEVGMGVDLDGDVEIQHSTAQYITTTTTRRVSLKSATHPSQQMDDLVEEDQAGLGWRCGGARRQRGRQAVHQSVG
jgi:hypothetical protein